MNLWLIIVLKDIETWELKSDYYFLVNSVGCDLAFGSFKHEGMLSTVS